MPRADRGRQARAENAHIAGEYEKPVAKDVEDTASQHACSRQGGAAVVAQECGEHLVEQEKWNGEFDGQQVILREWEQRVRRAEQPQHGRVEKRDDAPPKHGEQHRKAERGGKVLVFILVPHTLAAAQRGEQHRPADARQQAEAVNDVPYRRDHGQGRRAIRPLVLADHRHIHDAVNRADERAAERCGQIPEVQRTNAVCQQIHVFEPPFAGVKKAG